MSDGLSIEQDTAEDNNTVLTGEPNTDQGAGDSGAGDQGTTDEGSSENAGADTGGEEAGGEGSQTPPDTYADFALPEGMSLDEGLLTEAAPLFKELGLTQEQAQKLVDFQAKQVQAGSQKQVDAFNQQLNEWNTATLKEFSEEQIATARGAVDAYGTPELKQLLNDYGVGSHPEVVRFMEKVGATLKEDVPGGSTNPAAKAKDVVNQLYPNDRNG